MRKGKKKISIPFWTQILSILLIGVLASGIVLLFVLNKPPNKSKENMEKHTVTFAYLDGTIIETKTVEKGKGVFPPILKNDGVFRGWSSAFNAVEKDIEVHPIFYHIKEENLFYFDSVYVQEDKKFTLDVYVGGKVNVSSGTITLSYDPEVLEYIQANGLEDLSVAEDQSGELKISFNNNTPLKEKTLISQLTFYAKKKDAYATQANLTASDMKTIVAGQDQTADCATINNKIYFLQEVGE